MTRLAQLLHLDDGEFPEIRAQIESKPLPVPPAPKRPGWARGMLNHLHAEAPVDGRDPYRYDPNRLLPRSAMVRRVCVDRIPQDRPELAPVSQRCAALGLVYAERHIAAELAALAPVEALLKDVAK
jgi:hypothetical protein